MPDVRLTVNGREYAGWTDVTITRGIEAIAGSFSLKVSDRWEGQAKPWPIEPEDECTVAVDRTTLITGYVDGRVHGLQAGGHTLQVSGRDKAGALVDNSAVLSQWEFSNIGVLEFCRKVAEPFGVTVSLQEGITDSAIGTAPRGATSNARSGGAPASVGSAGKSSSMTIGKPNAKLAINPGDSPFEVIERACRMAGVLAVSDGIGNVVLTRAGGLRATTELVEGQNILVGESTFDATKRYRKYIVSGQAQGSDELFGAAAASVKAEAEDAGATRASRVLLIRPEGAVTLAFAKQRAAWEATVRKARALTATISVQGWTQNGGALWPINAIVAVRSPRLGLNGDLLITEATYRLSSESGTTTELKVVGKDAFIPEPVLTSTGSGDSALRSVLG